MDLEINEIELKNSLYEVNEVINRLSNEECGKIPKELLEKIKIEKNNNHDWQYNDEVELYQQSFSEYTLPILAMINLEYLLSPEKKQMMECVHQLMQHIYNM